MAYERKTIDTWEFAAELRVRLGVHIDRVHKRRGKGETERVQRESASVPSKTC